jgi:MoxR-like ATPase
MTRNSQYRFNGDQKQKTDKPHKESPSTPEPYIATEELKEALNLAIYLGRPLLLEGEAGCGKTRLARAAAYEFGLPFYTWNVRSTSKAQEGLYTYDSILRLHDVQVERLRDDKQNETHPIEPEQQQRDPRKASDYVKLGALGRAFSLKECPAVVLIDEIDKADLDFPNDLLTVLDDPWQFDIPETDEPPIKAVHPPIVIITSNKEKGNLPAPFLRRCIYHFVKFPDDEERLKKIVKVHYEMSEQTPPQDGLTSAAASRFLKLREEGNLYKKPGTSEFLDWLEALYRFKSAPYSPDLLAPEQKLPYPELLLKLRADWQRHQTNT